MGFLVDIRKACLVALARSALGATLSCATEAAWAQALLTHGRTSMPYSEAAPGWGVGGLHHSSPQAQAHPTSNHRVQPSWEGVPGALGPGAPGTAHLLPVSTHKQLTALPCTDHCGLSRVCYHEEPEFTPSHLLGTRQRPHRASLHGWRCV
ncbi:hypothetical protein NDU88_007275 [Pleurodeles waltl]|uniref:Secreted protein n=1 Tax=Pleurodeles waltl TaxID=8319 RepID=A0AAV7MMI2_PLEWA|nr:hypothetical protein NDU88_007275 [Pleurodeles waltl]